MKLRLFEDRVKLSRAAAQQGAAIILQAIRERGKARIVVATAASQLDFLDCIVRMPDIDWSCVEVFHLDEYVGLTSSHPGSFRRMLLEYLIHRTNIREFHLLEGDAVDPAEAARIVGSAIASSPIDVAFIGIGENGHIAFNDPPADFTTEDPYILVGLDEACRKQQVAEGWFKSLEDVPTRAISMSIRQILTAREILALVPGHRKAQAVKACFEGAIHPEAPASILRTHRAATVFLDKESAALLRHDDVDLPMEDWPDEETVSGRA